MTEIKPAPDVIRVAHSPDSDDAFMFWALAHHKIDAEGLTFEHILTDIETLNKEAMKGTYELTAISYHAYAKVYDKYAILNVGSSVGDKYGPVVIAKKPFTKEELKNVTVAVPGEMTTAYLALKIWEPELKTEVVPFEQIMERVESGEFEAGLIIHEGQLTYENQGLSLIVDLGKWWFEDTDGLPLPLGANAIRRDLGQPAMDEVTALLKQSIQYGLDHREEALAHALQYGRDLDHSKADEFVGMYVNDWTLDFGEKGKHAVELLLKRGFEAGVIPNPVELEFIG